MFISWILVPLFYMSIIRQSGSLGEVLAREVDILGARFFDI